MAKPREFKLNIIAALRAADNCDLNYYNTLNDQEKKDFVPLIFMRWMSLVSNGSLSDHYINSVNNFVNIGFWELNNHPELLWKLFATCGIGTAQRHNWLSGSKKLTTSKLDDLLLMFNPSLNDMELNLMKKKLTADNLGQLCKDYAMDNSEIKPIMADFKKYVDANN